MSAAKWADLGERTVWTLLEAGIGTAAVDLAAAGLPNWAWLSVPIAGALSAIKSALAVKFGNGTGATLPVALESVPAGKHAAPED